MDHTSIISSYQIIYCKDNCHIHNTQNRYAEKGIRCRNSDNFLKCRVSCYWSKMGEINVRNYKI